MTKDLILKLANIAEDLDKNLPFIQLAKEFSLTKTGEVEKRYKIYSASDSLYISKDEYGELEKELEEGMK